MADTPRQRLRITFGKTAAMRFTGHLDLHKTWERTLRRARLPLAYSQGYHPQPRLQLASALPLGFTSECEVADILLEKEQDLGFARAALATALPPGLTLQQVEPAPLKSPALQTLLESAEYHVTLFEPIAAAALDQQIAALLAHTAIPRTRRGKAYDLRPLIERLERAQPAEGGPALHMRLTAREGATGRPEEVVEALGLSAAAAAYHRTALHFR